MNSERSNIFGPATPIFRVENLAAAIEYYRNAMGFQIDWEGPGPFASVSRDHCRIFLSEGDQGHPGTWTWIGVEDADALAAEFRGRGARIRHAPANYLWAYEMQVEDPDGNVLRFGSDPKKGEPYGEWLDMQGRTWPPGGAS